MLIQYVFLDIAVFCETFGFFFFPFFNFKLLTLSNTVIPAVVSTIVENKKQRYFCYGKCYSTEEARLR